MKSIQIITLISVVMLGSFTAKAQIDFGTYLEAGAEDANRILQSYMEPAFLGIGYGLNSGWYNTAKPHKLFGFDITATGTMALIPSSAEFYTFNNNSYSNVQLADGSLTTARAPTIFGPNLPADELPLLEYFEDRANTDESITLSAPTGLGIEEDLPFNAVPTAMVQVGIGIVKNTDIKIRFVPTIESTNEFEYSMLGIGVMHDLKQWIPGFKQLPIDISGFVGWSRVNTKIFLDDEAPDQFSEFSTNGFTLQGLVSKQLSILTVFGGLGFASTSSSFDLRGTYNVEGGTLTDPVSFNFSSGGPRANLGFRLKLLVLTLHADYAIQKYNTLTVGAGISIR